jgi:hypothetical protein
MTAVTSFARFFVLGTALLAMAACTPVWRPDGVTASDVPPGANSFATDTKLEIIQTFEDVTAKADPTEIEAYRAIAMTAFTEKLQAEKLSLLPANADAPLKMRFEILIRRWDPLFGGGAYTKAIVTNQSGKELFTTNTAAPLDLILNGLDSKIALRDASSRLADGIINGLKPLRSPAS